MTELDHALSQLAFIQDRFDASTRFRGIAPQTVGATGLIAIALAGLQTAWPGPFGATGLSYIILWVAAAAVCATLIGIEALERAPRLHGGFADRMLAGTLRLLLPFGAVGAVITLVVVRIAPEAMWMLPGLWQLLIALIGFAAVSTLPPAIVWPAGWYLACGTTTLLLAGQAGAATPWMMGVPFGVGQLAVAIVLQQAGRRDGR